MIKPQPKTVEKYLKAGNDQHLVRSLLDDQPWLFASQSIDFDRWAEKILLANSFSGSSALYLVGSAATGFSLNPEKLGAAFRGPLDPPKPSDLDFALVDEGLFIGSWNELIAEDRIRGPASRPDEQKIRVYWGRIEQYVLPKKILPRIRKMIDSIRRETVCRGHKVSIRVYRRREDLVGYSVSCIRHLRRSIEP